MYTGGTTSCTNEPVNTSSLSGRSAAAVAAAASSCLRYSTASSVVDFAAAATAVVACRFSIADYCDRVRPHVRPAGGECDLRSEQGGHKGRA